MSFISLIVITMVLILKQKKKHENCVCVYVCGEEAGGEITKNML